MDQETGSTLVNYGDCQDTAFPVTDIQEGRSRIYHTRLKTAAGLSTGESVDRDSRRERRTGSDSAETRYAVTRWREEAIEHARAMEEAAEAKEPVDLGIAGMSLIESLREMWRLRSSQSDEWGTIVNYLQSSLADQVLENLTPGQCSNLRSVLEDHLVPSADTGSIESAIDLLEDSDFQPLKPLMDLGKNC
ncbi:MAG TPA: hypothetical protein VM492_09120 [Sumerlaeia bacterium]|nr:hypothetical protein [Sumerlaeia bacterium]